MKVIFKKSVAMLLAIIMIVGMYVPSFASEHDHGNEVVNEKEAEQFMEEIGVADPTDTESTHAYDPFAEMKEQQAEEEYRESVDIVEGKLLFAVRDVRAEGENGVYLTDSSELCKNAELSDVAFVLETVNKTAATENGQVAYDVYYEAKTTEDVWAVVDALNENEDIVYAEPDFIWENTAVGSYTEISSAEIQHGHHHGKLESEKNWGNIEETNGSAPGENVVVAVIDTGVDYTHEDLKNSMWTNWFEIPDNGIDDDYNGYVDDYYGADFIENDSDPMDDNGHGTHVAGIIAMEPNNVGGVGVAYGTKIMAIKAGQANGSFASTDIAKAINYAVMNGADVINMSFGGEGKSSLVEAALQDAFGTAVLVAAAGNNGLPTTDYPVIPGIDIYPAGYSYVIGVMASDESNTALASFSNWDYIQYKNCEYEIVAPGSAIYSTIPGNRYAEWNGTSMAAPMVSAAAALIRSKYQDRSMYTSRFIMGQLVSATDDVVNYEDSYGAVHSYPSLNIEDSLNKIPKPDVYVSEMYIIDSTDISSANNGDGIMQVGETVDILFSVSNRWGIASDVVASIDTTVASAAGMANPYVEVINGSVSIEDIGTYMSQNNGYIYTDDVLTGATKPIRIKISDNAPNDAMVTFSIDVSCKNGMDPEDTGTYLAAPYKYTFVIQNGFTLSGVIKEDMTLTADKYWIIDNSVLIAEEATVTVEPGAQIQFWSSDTNDPYATEKMAYIEVKGEFIVKGTEDAPIDMFPSKAFEQFCVRIILEGYESNVEFSYVNVINPYLSVTKGDHIYAVQNTNILYDRVLEDGVVSQVYLDIARFESDQLSKSIIKNFRPTPYVGDNGYGLIGDCILYDNCVFDFSGTNSVFLINNYNYEANERVSIIESVKDYSDPDPSYSPILSYGNKKYVIAYVPEVIDVFDELSGSLCGYAWLKAKNCSVVSINSEDEDIALKEFICSEDTLNWLKDSSSKSSFRLYLGLYSDANKELFWSDGSSDYYPELNSISQDSYLYMKVNVDKNTSYGWSQTPRPEAVVLEFPGDMTDEDVLKNVSPQEYFVNIKLEDNWLSNNAILNPIKKTDSYDMWTKVLGRDRESFPYVSAVNNYWGTESKAMIENQITDENDYISLSDVVYEPYLTLESPELETIYPFVTEAYVTDLEGNKLDVVSSGRVQMHVKFNRDMAQDIDPMVSFGGAYPYTDFVVNGDWASAREWIGEINITPYINQGVMYIRVKGGAAADDKWLVCGTDVGRFTFEISKTGAQSMTLQGIGKTGKNVLSWMQDDYETLAGYNIYRSTSYDNTIDVSKQSFEKINPYLMWGASYEDENVSVGTDYYYYFTVMDTDFNESEPSNVVECTPKEAVPPTIGQPTVMSSSANAPIRISTEVTDNVAVTGVKLYYKMDTSANWASIDMRKTTGNNYQAIIAAYEVKNGSMLYYISATDGNNTAYYGNAEEPNKIVIGHEHIWDEGVVSQLPTCIKGGSTKYTCGICGATYEESVPATGEHNFSEEWTVDIEPTTTEGGEMSRHCLDCDARTDITPIEPMSMKGDIDGDGKITMLDSFKLKLLIKQIVEATDKELAAADINNDGLINMMDSFELKYRIKIGVWRSKED